MVCVVCNKVDVPNGIMCSPCQKEMDVQRKLHGMETSEEYRKRKKRNEQARDRYLKKVIAKLNGGGENGD
jgi:hypothetical protein